MSYGKPPVYIRHFDFDLDEVMYYLYLPVRIPFHSGKIALPANVEVCRPLINAAREFTSKYYDYVYLSARKGWATPDNPLNRPGWHCDGFGTDDLNFVWWVGPGTRFAVQEFHDISTDHILSIKQFEEQIRLENIVSYLERGLYALDPEVVHATPLIGAPGCMRQFVKISLSNERYNLENNSHNYLLDYNWPLHSRDIIRNDPHKAQLDYIAT